MSEFSRKGIIVASKSKQRKIRNNEGTRVYSKGDKKHKCKGCYMYCSTDRRRLNKIEKDY
jgi:Pyruvate/2-oxoacid:ferredoxin oxidoreductase delta subunit